MDTNRNEARELAPVEAAFHEAGHAVAAVVLGVRVDSASIVPSEGYQGRALGRREFYGYCTGRQCERKRAHRGIIVAYAGLEAQRLVNPSATDGNSAWADENVLSLLQDYPPRGCRTTGDDVCVAYLDRRRSEAWWLVRQHRTEIDRVAQALMARGTLTSVEIMDLVVAGDV